MFWLVLVRYMGIGVIEDFGDVVDSFMISDPKGADDLKLLVKVEVLLRRVEVTTVADLQHTPTSS
jgi:hypothetical protein